MTPQEASEELKEEFEIFKNCIKKADWENPDEELRKIIEANTMAIEILEQQPCEDCTVIKKLSEKCYVEDAYGYTDEDLVNKVNEIIDVVNELSSVTPQPFINKPCISEGVCREDKIQVLDKIRAEIEQTRKMYLDMNDIDWLNGCDYVLSVFDKYKAENEVKE